MRTRFITAYTPDFEARAMALVESGAAHGWQIEAIPYDVDYGDWLLNMRHRPRIVLNELAKGRPVMWIDADSTIIGPCDELTVETMEAVADFAGCTLEPNALRNRRYRGMPQFWNDTELARHVCRRYAELSEQDVDCDDEWFLEAARLEAPDDVRWGIFGDLSCWVPGCHPMPPPDDVLILTKSSGRNPFRADGTRRSGRWKCYS